MNDAKVTIGPYTHFTSVDGRIILANFASGDYWSLDPVGTRIWELLVVDGSVDNVLDVLREELPVDGQRLGRDVGRFLRDCEAAGLIRIAGSEP